MLIRVEDIEDDGLFLEFGEKPETFPALQETIESGAADFKAPLHVRLRAIRVGEIVELEGTVESRIGVSCSRCLREFETPLIASFAVAFARGYGERPLAEGEEEEVEISAEEMGLIPFQGDEIDLRVMLQEQVITGLPLRPLCNEACRGLCPQCGKDLNEGECGCSAPDEFPSRFSKLKDFKIDPAEPGKK